jgi:hypothetical protein
MKTFPLVLLTVFLALFARAGFAQSAQEILTEAQRAYMQGDVDGAKQKFKIVTEMEPHNLTAQRYLGMIAAQEKANGQTGGERQKQLKELILPRVDLNEANFNTTLDYLKQTAAKQGEKNISFVVQVPSDIVDTKKVTLNLSNIPFTEVLRYLGELTGFKFSIDKYAIVVKLPQAEAPASATPSPAAQ